MRKTEAAIAKLSLSPVHIGVIWQVKSDPIAGNRSAPIGATPTLRRRTDFQK